jgi:hypothetical protein
MKILDPVRRKYSANTPEEQVRQALIHYLHTQCAAPLSLMSVEKEFTIGSMQRKYDVVIFDNSGNPLLLAECKAPSVTLSNKVFAQAAHYNTALHAPCLLITNGLKTYCSRIVFESGQIVFLEKIPNYNEMKLWLKSSA